MNQLVAQKATVLSLDSLLRTLSRGQAFDVLSSQANVAGYRAVIEAAHQLQRPFAGTHCIYFSAFVRVVHLWSSSSSFEKHNNKLSIFYYQLFLSFFLHRRSVHGGRQDSACQGACSRSRSRGTCCHPARQEERYHIFSYDIGVVILIASGSLVCDIPIYGTTAKYHCSMDILHVLVIFALGAIVSGFDVRSAAKEQVESVGARFLEVT